MNHSSPFEARGDICTVVKAAPDVFRVRSVATLAPDKVAPSNFMEVLEGWGQTWIWESLRLVGDYNWLAESIRGRTLMAVMDGSYIQELYPNLCSTASVFECRAGRGRLGVHC